MAMPASAALSAAPRRISPKHLPREFLIGEANEIKGRQRLAAHGVNVAERVGRGDRAKIVRPVDDGGEKIGREDQGQLVVDFVDGRIVGRGTAHQHVGIGNRGSRPSKRKQVAGGLLGGAAGPLGQLGQANFACLRFFRCLAHGSFASGSSSRQQPRFRCSASAPSICNRPGANV